MEDQIKELSPSGISGVAVTLRVRLDYEVENIIERAAASPACSGLSNQQLADLVFDAISEWEVLYSEVLAYVNGARKG